MNDKIIVKNAVKRKKGFLYFIDYKGNLCEYDFTPKWVCKRCRFTHRSSIRPTKCSCKSGYVKHVEFETLFKSRKENKNG